MLLQTNSYVVPKDKRNEHTRLVRRFRQSLARLGCDHFEVYEQVSQNWGGQDSGGRYVQIMRFRDRRHQLEVQAAERADPGAQALIQEFCELINFPFQQQQGLFAVGFYSSVLPTVSGRDIGIADDEAGPTATQEQQGDSAEVSAPSASPGDSAQSDAAAELRNGQASARGSVDPIFYEPSPADNAAAPSPPTGPKLVSDELDSGLTDLSDSNLMDLPDLEDIDAPIPDAPDPPAQSHMRLAQNVVEESDVRLFEPDESAMPFGEPPASLSLREGSHDSLTP
jgi:hypothetical protein